MIIIPILEIESIEKILKKEKNSKEFDGLLIPKVLKANEYLDPNKTIEYELTKTGEKTGFFVKREAYITKSTINDYCFKSDKTKFFQKFYCQKNYTFEKEYTSFFDENFSLLDEEQLIVDRATSILVKNYLQTTSKCKLSIYFQGFVVGKNNLNKFTVHQNQFIVIERVSLENNLKENDNSDFFKLNLPDIVPIKIPFR